jgi:effector-binding domain-containing protein
MKKINKQKIIEEWIHKNGCASFNLKEKGIILHDGGLFYIEKKKVKGSKIVGYKKLPRGYVEVLFSKKKTVPYEDYSAIIHFEDVEDTINYFKRVKKLLNKLGYETRLKRE